MQEQAFALLYQDKKLLENTKVPIITVSASFKEDLKGFHGEPENDQIQDIVFSRAHYSMALAVAVAAWGNKIDAKKAWLVDPTNHIKKSDWKQVILTDTIGRTVARQPLLKILKDVVDRFGRSKLPILENIEPATKFLTQNLDRPILSFHIATGNILAANGKQVLQMITDPHVRSEYVQNADQANIRFMVFDEKTKEDFFSVAAAEQIKIPAEQIQDKVIVTGPPVDPRTLAAAQSKKPWTNERPLKILITTGGLGTNKQEIKKILDQLLPLLNHVATDLPKIEIMYYAGTHADHQQMAVTLAKKHHIKYHLISPHDPADFTQAGWLNRAHRQPQSQIKFHIIYHPQIIDANELLIRYGFPWADVFISKPSGDMAYDAALSGSALLTLKEWGEWEHNVRAVFEQYGISQKADVEQIVEQILRLSQKQSVRSQQSEVLTSSVRPIPQLDSPVTDHDSWITQAMINTQKLPKIFYQGANNILQAIK
ncbi:hypothetical protein KBB59_01805 [Candidatus Woesebacteria bacterium]|nr:hypothetical protein [Candidatus Woesebacteria bacterium]HOA12113.1 hypothetical protein [Candidatus Woesebacteria bacterium]HOP39005.1 hypothetical protein [Candidatus Woesebacteria bacterium]